MYAPCSWDGIFDHSETLSRAVEEGGTVDEPADPVEAQAVAFVISAFGLGGYGMVTDPNLLFYPAGLFCCWNRPLIGVFYAVTGLFSPNGDGTRTGQSGEQIRRGHHGLLATMHWLTMERSDKLIPLDTTQMKAAAP